MSDATTTEPATAQTSANHEAKATNGTPVPPKRSRRPFLGEWVKGLDFFDALFVEPPSRSLEESLEELHRIQAPLRHLAERAASRAKRPPHWMLEESRSVNESLVGDIVTLSGDLQLAWRKLRPEVEGNE